MNILQQQNDLESFADDMLVQESQQPSGRYPGFLIMTEMQRRKDLRQRAQAQQHQPEPTVSEQLTQETQQQGIASIPGAQVNGFAGGGMIDGYAHGGGPASGVKRLAMSGYAQGGTVGGSGWPRKRQGGKREAYERKEEERRSRLDRSIIMGQRRQMRNSSDEALENYLAKALRDEDPHHDALGPDFLTNTPFSSEAILEEMEVRRVKYGGGGAHQYYGRAQGGIVGYTQGGMVDGYARGGFQEDPRNRYRARPRQGTPVAEMLRRQQEENERQRALSEMMGDPSMRSGSGLGALGGVLGSDLWRFMQSGQEAPVDPWVNAVPPQAPGGIANLSALQGGEHSDIPPRLSRRASIPKEPPAQGPSRESREQAIRRIYGESQDYSELRDMADAASLEAQSANRRSSELGEEESGILDDQAEMLRGEVEENPSGLETELRNMRRSPESQKKDRLAIALTGIGSLIAGSRNMGDIGAGMAGVTRDMMARGDTLRSEDIALMTQVSQLEDARKARNIDLKSRALAAEGMSVQVRREVATESVERDERIRGLYFEVVGTELTGKERLAEALVNGDAAQREFDEVIRVESVARVTSPADAKNWAEVYERILRDPQMMLLPAQREELMERINYYDQVWQFLLDKQTPGGIPARSEQAGGDVTMEQLARMIGES